MIGSVPVTSDVQHASRLFAGAPVGEVRVFLDSVLSGSGVAADLRADIVLMTVEQVAHAATHADTRAVGIDLDLDADRVTVTVHEHQVRVQPGDRSALRGFVKHVASTSFTL